MMFAGAAVMGYIMFGDSTLSQFTLNMPHDLVMSRVAVWTTVIMTQLLHDNIFSFSVKW